MKTKEVKTVAWKVFLGETLIDVVFWDKYCNPGGAEITANDVKKSLIDHDGYNSNIWLLKK